MQGKGAEVGYFPKSQKIPGKKITYTKAAIMQHTGFRIKISGSIKADKARKWLAAQLGNALGGKAFLKRVKSIDGWLVVPARPFMYLSLDKYIESGEDTLVVNQFIDKMMKRMTEVEESEGK